MSESIRIRCKEDKVEEVFIKVKRKYFAKLTKKYASECIPIVKEKLGNELPINNALYTLYRKLKERELELPYLTTLICLVIKSSVGEKTSINNKVSDIDYTIVDFQLMFALLDKGDLKKYEHYREKYNQLFKALIDENHPFGKIQLNENWDLYDGNCIPEKELKKIFLDFNWKQSDNGSLKNKNSDNLYPKLLTTVPRTNPSNIIGRSYDIEMLHKMLFDEKKNILVRGMTGIGKSTLVSSYIFKYYDFYENIVWLQQTNRKIKELISNNNLLIENLEIDLSAYSDADDIFNKTLSKLNNIPNQPKLFVIDDANTEIETFINSGKLPLQPNWHFLVTSTNAINGLNTYSIGFLKYSECVELFKKHCSIINDNDIGIIINSFDKHTLVIEILAKTAQRQRLSLEQILNAIKIDQKSGVKTQHSKLNRINRIHTYLSKLFSVSNCNQQELSVLKHLIVLPTKYYTFETLNSLIGDCFVKGEYTFSEVLNDLIDKGWLISNDTDGSILLHSIVKEVLSKEIIIIPNQITILLYQIQWGITKMGQRLEPLQGALWSHYAESVHQYFKLNISSVEILNFYSNYAMYLYVVKKFKKSSNIYESIISEIEKNSIKHLNNKEYKNIKLIQAKAYSYLAECYSFLDLSKQSQITLFKKSKEVYERLSESMELSPNEILQHDHSFVLNELGEYKKAVSYSEKTINTLIKKPLSEDDKLLLASNCISLSDICFIGRDIDKATIFLNLGITIQSEILGRNSLRVAESLMKLASLNRLNDNYNNAISLQKEAVESIQNHYGVHHFSTLIPRKYLAIYKFEEATNRYEAFLEAESLKESFFEFFGSNHQESLTLVNALRKMKDIIEKEKN